MGKRGEVLMWLGVGILIFGNFGILLFPLTPWILIAGAICLVAYICVAFWPERSKCNKGIAESSDS